MPDPTEKSEVSEVVEETPTTSGEEGFAAEAATAVDEFDLPPDDLDSIEFDAPPKAATEAPAKEQEEKPSQEGAAEAADSGPKAQESQTKDAEKPAAESKQSPDPAPAEATRNGAESGEAVDFATGWAQAREQIVEHLATTQFALSPEEIDTLGIDPAAGQVLSKLMGRVAHTAIDSAQRLLQDQVPSLIEGQMATTKEVAAAEDKFFTRWPQLHDAKYAPQLKRVVDTYRAANPDAPMDQAIEEVGTIAATMLKVPLVLETKAKPSPKPNGAFSPASAKSVPTRAPNLTETDPWAGAFETE